MSKICAFEVDACCECPFCRSGSCEVTGRIVQDDEIIQSWCPLEDKEDD